MPNESYLVSDFSAISRPTLMNESPDTNKKTIPRFVPGDYHAMNLISVVRCIMAYWEQCWSACILV